MKILIGELEGKKVHLDIPTFMRTRMLVQAASGQGKSHWLRRLVEELSKLGIQVFVIDHEGEFATLRKEFDFFLAGEGGDLPIDIRTAAVTAHRFLEMRASCVFDLSETFRSRPRDRHTWVKNFLGNGMMEAPKRLWTPVVLVVDEAHKYMPEKDESEASDAMISVSTDGRKREFCMVAATQRLSKVSKDGAAELLNKLMGGTSLGLDRKRAAEEMGVYGPDLRAFNDEIKTIDRGFFWCLGPAISKERVLVKVGETVTAAPARGSRAAAPPPAPEKVKAMLIELGDLAKVAAVKAQTEADLRAEIKSLKTQLREKPSMAKEVKIADTKAIEAAIRPLRLLLEEAMRVVVKINAIGFDDAGIKPEEIAKALEATAKEISKLAKAGLEKRAVEFEKLKREANAILAKVNKLLSQENLAVSVKVVHNEPFSVNAIPGGEIQKGERLAQRNHPRPDVVATNGELSRPQQAILRALAEFDAIGRNAVPKTWIAALSGASHKSSSYSNNLGFLRSSGYIDYTDGGAVVLTASGKEHAPQIEPPSSSEEMLSRCLAILSKPQGEILKQVHAVHPQSINKEELAPLSGASPTSSSYSNNLGALRSAGMIEYLGSGVKAADWLFL